MADQKINALPTKTSPTTGDKMLMIGAAEEYQIDYDQLATAILNKLTSKTFTLDQGTKTLVAALNELNSNKISNTNSINRTKMSLNDITDNFVLIESSYITDMPEEISSSMSSWILIITFKVDVSNAGVQFVTSLFNATELNLKIFKRRLSEGAWNEFKQIN